VGDVKCVYDKAIFVFFFSLELIKEFFYAIRLIGGGKKKKKIIF
jgi:hypothetical protein